MSNITPIRPTCARCAFVRKSVGSNSSPLCKPCRSVMTKEEIMSYSYPTLAPSSIPVTQPHDERPHVCGKCRNPFTTGNAHCPNNSRDAA